MFGMHLNFDGGLDADAIEADALSILDFAQPLPHRKYARLWLMEDYGKAVATSSTALPAVTARNRAILSVRV